MDTKFIEIRDRGTFIPAVAIRVAGEDHYLARRAGYGAEPAVILMNLDTCEAANDPYDWRGGARTYPTVHNYLYVNWDKVKSGEVIDVEFILGEKAAPKRSEAETNRST